MRQMAKALWLQAVEMYRRINSAKPPAAGDTVNSWDNVAQRPAIQCGMQLVLAARTPDERARLLDQFGRDVYARGFLAGSQAELDTPRNVRPGHWSSAI